MEIGSVHTRRSSAIGIAATFLVALLSLTACGQDLGKANFPRTTVTQPPPSGQSPTDPITDPAVASNVLRTVAPCPLLDNSTMSALGQPGTPSVEGLDQCSVSVTDAGGKSLKFTLRLGEPLTGGTKNASGLIEGLPQLEVKTDQNTCSVAAVTSRSPELGVTAEVVYPGGDSCGAGRTGLRNVVKRLHQNPAQLPQPAGSFVAVDPCAIVSDDVMASVLGQTTKTATSFHSCLWSPKTTGAGGKLFLRQLAPLVPDSTTQKVDLGNGIQGFQRMPSPTVAQCLIDWVHRTVSDSQVEVVSFLYDNSGVSVTADNPCPKAVTVAKAIEEKLPKP